MAEDDVELKPLAEDKRLVIFGEDYTADYPVGLHLKTKWSWSGDSMSVKDQNDETWFRVKGDVWSLSETKVIYGKDDKPLFAIADKRWWNPLNDDQLIYDCRGIEDLKEARDIKKDKSKLLFEVKSNVGNTKQKTSVKNIGAKGVAPEMVDIVGKCTFFKAKCSMYRDGDHATGGIPLAKFMSPLEFQNFIGKGVLEGFTEDFFLTIAAGADIAFCLAFVIAIREMDKSYFG